MKIGGFFSSNVVELVMRFLCRFLTLYHLSTVCRICNARLPTHMHLQMGVWSFALLLMSFVLEKVELNFLVAV